MSALLRRSGTRIAVPRFSQKAIVFPECFGARRYGRGMKFLDVDGVGRVSRIGLGTWQFGSREWGYGDDYASGPARDIVQRAGPEA